MRLCRSTKLKSGSSYSFSVSACRVLHLRWLLQFVCQTLSLSLSPSLPPSLPVSLSLCLSLSLSLSLCVSVSMHPEAEEGFKELSKISDRETWPGTILKRYQNDNRNNGKWSFVNTWPFLSPATLERWRAMSGAQRALAKLQGSSHLSEAVSQARANL